MDSVIESMKAKGFTYLGIVEGEKIFCNLESDDSINNCLEFLEKLTGEEWETFREASGNENLVFYKTSMYFDMLDFYLVFRGGKYVELPLNCSSCEHMFEDCNLSVDLFIDNEFDTSKVEDMNFMFQNCRLPEGFSLGDKFDTSRVKNMDFMFQNCKLPEGKTREDFNSEVEIIEWLKSRCTGRLSAF